MPSKERQRQLAREKIQRQMARRAAAARRRRRVQAVTGSALAVVAVLALAALGVARVASHHKPAKPAAAAKTSAPARNACAYTRPTSGQGGEVPRKVTPPPVGATRTGKVAVQLTTNQGPLTLTLDRSKAPCTVNSFVSLVEQKYFDKTPCHRLTTQGIYVLQCGDPSGTGTGGPGYVFADENLPAKKNAAVTYPAGTVAMANSGPNTNGGQFFIVYKDSQFTPNYTIFGKLSSGIDVVQKIAKAGSNPTGDGKPKTPVEILQAKLLA